VQAEKRNEVVSPLFPIEDEKEEKDGRGNMLLYPAVEEKEGEKGTLQRRKGTKSSSAEKHGGINALSRKPEISIIPLKRKGSCRGGAGEETQSH